MVTATLELAKIYLRMDQPNTALQIYTTGDSFSPCAVSMLPTRMFSTIGCSALADTRRADGCTELLRAHRVAAAVLAVYVSAFTHCTTCFLHMDTAC
jgi:hypothetical protein